MTFVMRDNLVTARTFSDFVWQMRQNPKNLKCPICAQPIEMKVLSTFDMNRHGAAMFRCLKTGCEFNRMHFSVQTIAGLPK